MTSSLLLRTAKIGIAIARLVFALAAVVLAIGIIGFAFFAGAEEFGEINRALVDAGNPMPGRIAMALVFGFGFASMALAERFLQQLKRILDTVGKGDPFTPENGDRLQRMGWIALLLQGVGLATTLYSLEVEQMASKLTIDGDFSIEGLFLVALLFILASVFRHGAAMRDDLEGTV